MLVQLVKEGHLVNLVEVLSDQGISKTEARRRIRAGAVKIYDNGDQVKAEDEHLFCELPVVIQFGKRDWVRVDK